MQTCLIILWDNHQLQNSFSRSERPNRTEQIVEGEMLASFFTLAFFFLLSGTGQADQKGPVFPGIFYTSL